MRGNSALKFNIKLGKTMKKKLVFIAGLFASALLSAKIEMPKVFSDNMVLQRQMPVKIWGTAEPNAEVEVRFGGQSAKIRASEKGDWEALLKPMEASGTSRNLSVFENGEESKIIKNVLVGEVWIAGGQSNMALPMRECDTLKYAEENSDYPEIRYFHQPNVIARTPQKDSPKGSHWFACSKNAVGGMSGVAFHFAERLFKDLGVPVGILYSSSGATEMAAWIPREYGKLSPHLDSYMRDFFKEAENYDRAAYEKALGEYKKRDAEYKARCESAKKAGKPKPGRDWLEAIAPNEISPRYHFRSPTYHFNSTVSPIVGYSLRGVIWYQGESDSRDEKLPEFERNFKILVKSWRELWQMPKMPFLYVQLASYAEAGRPDGDKWAKTRWVQTLCQKSIPDIAMANIIDTGLKNNIHPTDKKTVGERLEKIALRKIYGKEDVNAYCPMFKSARYFNDRVEVAFDTYGRGLSCMGEPRGFELKVGGKWSPAESRIEGQRVIVRPSEFSEGRISGVRYLWKNWAKPFVWLYNQDGLPAVSFMDEN